MNNNTLQWKSLFEITFGFAFIEGSVKDSIVGQNKLSKIVIDYKRTYKVQNKGRRVVSVRMFTLTFKILSSVKHTERVTI